MRKASALPRFVALGIAAGVLMSGCGQAPQPVAISAGSGAPAQSGWAPAAAPGVPVAAQAVSKNHLTPGQTPGELSPGSIYRNPENGRDEVIVADIRRTALLIGDSQSEPDGSWPRAALSAIGYDVYFCGKGGTGFVAANGSTGNFIDALQRGDWLLPYGAPPLLVIQGGGNDASRGAGNDEIAANAKRLITSLKQRYPGAKLVMIGTLARGAQDGGGRRTEVDALLGTVARQHGIPFVSVGDWLTRYGLTPELRDGVHLKAEGHKALARLLETRLAALGVSYSGLSSK